jgi:hypothetical protein
MIEVKRKISNISTYVYWFADNIRKYDMWRIVTYKNYTGKKRPLMFIKHTSYTLETDLTQDDEQIFKSFKPNVRNEIRKSEKMNFDLVINQISIDDFVKFYNSFALSKGFPFYDKRNLTCYKPENILFLSAINNITSELHVVHVYLIDGQKARLLHSISQIHDMENDEQRKTTGYFNRRLHWKAILYFKNSGYGIYDWGGYSHKYNDKSLIGINAFKKSFGGLEREVTNYNSVLREIIELFHKIKTKI